MALNFPGSPTNGQQYQGFVYNSSVQAWQSNPASVAPFYTADLPPTNPTVGDSWFNTNDGTMYIYTYDGNTYQWVEHRSEIARSQVGLVPIKPTSVTVSSGTATVDVSGLVTFTNAVNLNVAGVFTSAYKYYKIILAHKTVGGTSEIAAWFTNAGTSITTGWYGAGFYTQYAGATGNANARNNGNGGWISYASPSYYSEAIVDAYVEQSLNTPLYQGITYLRASGNQIFYGYGTDGACDGFRISPLTGGISLTGTMKVYGYN